MLERSPRTGGWHSFQAWADLRKDCDGPNAPQNSRTQSQSPIVVGFQNSGVFDVELTINEKTGSRQGRSDAELVVRCIRGDQDAWEQLVRQYERLIYSIALAICRDVEVASDILQQVCLELYQRLDEVRNVESLAAWLATVTRRKTYTHLRSARPTEPIGDDDDDLVVSPDLIANIERQHTLERALATLPARSRRLIELLYLSTEEKSYEEIAVELGIPVASVGPTRIRCLEKLRKFLA